MTVSVCCSVDAALCSVYTDVVYRSVDQGMLEEATVWL